MKKKILSLVLALLMAASSAAYVAADDVTATADDAAVTAVDENDSYAWAVEFLYNYGIYKGTSASDLATDEDIQRYQMALFVARISTGWVDDEKWEDGPQNTSIFTDVEDGAASNYLGAISYANQKGIIEGYGNGEFGPYDGISYQDALTMVTRTLGYQGLDWPWGYIQKAVELGLTEGIDDVAYTDILTRGEVAQIIYNALFATTKTGSTLALDYFNVEFGWEPIVITASDRDVFEKGAENTPADSNKQDAWVSFKLYNDDGSIDSGKDAVTYYALAEDLGLDVDKHEDELAVGTTYWVLFEKDADSNLVNIVDYRSTYVDTVWNLGKTDDEGNKQDYEIQKFLENYTLVSKYTPINYLSATKYLKPELIVYNSLASITVTEKGNVSGLAIDWQTGDILVKDSDGNYTVAWYYNTTLDQYYKYQKTVDGDVIGIDWMTDEEFEKTYKDALNDVEVSYTGWNVPVTKIDKTAYASLTLEDVNLDGVAERGFYEEYYLGYIKKTSKWCPAGCGENHDAYELFQVKNDIGTLEYTEGIGSWTGTAMPSDGYSFISKHTTAWFTDGKAVKDGYVIYSYDKDTREIKVVKEITNGDDADSFVATGVLRSYSPAKKTVVIGDTTYSMNYDELKGTGFYKVADNKAKYAAGLYSMLNQFVEYVVVDGEIVKINIQNDDSNYLNGYKYLIVKEYVGMTNDGYIAVDAYDTQYGKLATYCIGSYNGWKQGDYYYYLTEEKVRESFSAGTIYYVKSYDSANDVYYVELVGEHDENGGYTVDSSMVKLTKNFTVKFYNDGYRSDNGTTRKMTNDDVYIILAKNASSVTCKAPIYVYTGKVTDTTWTITGDKITDINGSSYNKLVFVNVTNVVGFDLDAYESGMYLYEGGKVLSAAYDSAHNSIYDADFKVKDRYILGAVTSEVEALNLYTGKRDAIIVDKNINLEKGHVYVTVSGKVVEEWDPWADNEVAMWDTETFIKTMATWFYQDRGVNPIYVDSADYLFGFFHKNDASTLSKSTMDYVLAGNNASAGANNYQTGIDKDGNLINGWYDYQRERVNTLKFYVVEFDGDTMKITYTDFDKYLADNPTVKQLYCGYIYEVSTGNCVVYANAAKTENLTKGLTLTKTLESDVNGEDGVDLKMTLTYNQYTDVHGDVVYVVPTKVKFFYTGAENMGHNDRAIKGLGFGHLSDHVLGSYTSDAYRVFNDWTNGNWKDLYTNRNNSSVVTYETWACEENLCDIVKSIEVNIDQYTKNNGAGFSVVLQLDVAPALGVSPAGPLTAAWYVGCDFEVTDGGLVATVIDDQYVNSSAFLATNPDAIQDTFTADAE